MHYIALNRHITLTSSHHSHIHTYVPHIPYILLACLDIIPHTAPFSSVSVLHPHPEPSADPLAAIPVTSTTEQDL